MKIHNYNMNVFTVGYYKHRLWFWRNVINFFRTFKYAYQRITRGYADCDVMDADKYLAGIITLVTKQLNQTKTGYPAKFFDENKPEEDAVRQWSDILSSISNSFNQYVESFDDDDISSAAANLGFDLLKENFMYLWD